MITRTPKLLLPMLFGLLAVVLAPGAALAQDGYGSATIEEPPAPAPAAIASHVVLPPVSTGHLVTVETHSTQSSDVADEAPAEDVSAPSEPVTPQITIATNPGQTGNVGFEPADVGPDGPPAELALTGPETPYLAFSGLGLVGLGVAASAAARRRLRNA